MSKDESEPASLTLAKLSVTWLSVFASKKQRVPMRTPCSLRSPTTVCTTNLNRSSPRSRSRPQTYTAPVSESEVRPELTASLTSLLSLPHRSPS